MTDPTPEELRRDIQALRDEINTQRYDVSRTASETVAEHLAMKAEALTMKVDALDARLGAHEAAAKSTADKIVDDTEARFKARGRRYMKIWAIPIFFIALALYGEFRFAADRSSLASARQFVGVDLPEATPTQGPAVQSGIIGVILGGINTAVEFASTRVFYLSLSEDERFSRATGVNHSEFEPLGVILRDEFRGQSQRSLSLSRLLAFALVDGALEDDAARSPVYDTLLELAHDFDEMQPIEQTQLLLIHQLFVENLMARRDYSSAFGIFRRLHGFTTGQGRTPLFVDGAATWTSDAREAHFEMYCQAVLGHWANVLDGNVNQHNLFGRDIDDTLLSERLYEAAGRTEACEIARWSLETVEQMRTFPEGSQEQYESVAISVSEWADRRDVETLLNFLDGQRGGVGPKEDDDAHPEFLVVVEALNTVHEAILADLGLDEADPIEDPDQMGSTPIPPSRVPTVDVALNENTESEPAVEVDPDADAEPGEEDEAPEEETDAEPSEDEDEGTE